MCLWLGRGLLVSIWVQSRSGLVLVGLWSDGWLKAEVPDPHNNIIMYIYMENFTPTELDPAGAHFTAGSRMSGQPHRLGQLSLLELEWPAFASAFPVLSTGPTYMKCFFLSLFVVLATTSSSSR